MMLGLKSRLFVNIREGKITLPVGMGMLSGLKKATSYFGMHAVSHTKLDTKTLLCALDNKCVMIVGDHGNAKRLPGEVTRAENSFFGDKAVPVLHQQTHELPHPHLG